MQTIDVKYFGQNILLADLPQYRKFYAKLAAETWEPRTFGALSAGLDRDTVYVDVGGWIGVTPFWASRLAKRVIVIEPDPACLAILTALAPLYPNVTVIAGALSSEKHVTIHAIEEFGSSETSVLDIGTGGEQRAEGRSFAEILAPVRSETIFVKIDIEGYEYAIREEIEKLGGYRLKGMQLALHPQLFEKTLAGPCRDPPAANPCRNRAPLPAFRRALPASADRSLCGARRLSRARHSRITHTQGRRRRLYAEGRDTFAPVFALARQHFGHFGIDRTLLECHDPAVIAGQPADQFGILPGKLEAGRIVRLVLMSGAAREHDQKGYG